MLKSKNWRRLGENRDAWRWRTEEAKAQYGCSAIGEEKYVQYTSNPALKSENLLDRLQQKQKLLHILKQH
jgi:hypothetical protein